MTFFRLLSVVLVLASAQAASAQYGPVGPPAPGPLRIVGGGSNGGCIAGAVNLPDTGEWYQTIHGRVTNFWGAYSYLDDHDRITAFVRRLIAWTAPGGALYLELITPATLAAFNALAFAASADAAVRLRSADGVMWSYRDPGGWHDLTSPPLETFEALLAPWFREVSVRGDVATMQQLVAVDRSAARLGQ